MKIDALDKKIIGILTTDARAAVSSIAKRVGSSRDNVHYRIQRLKKNEIIREFHTFLDPVKLGFPIFSFVNFTFNNFDDTNERNFYSYLSAMPPVVYLAKTTGKWDCTIAIAAKTLEDFDNIMHEIRKKFPNIIKEYDTASILKEYKYDTFEELI